MSTHTIAVDLAKHVFEIAVSTEQGKISERRRMSRTQFEHFWTTRTPGTVVMEACASSHFWARRVSSLGFDVVLLPPQYVRPYVRRNKTDRTDCEALLEAHRCGQILPVTPRSEEQQAVSALHRVRSQWMATRTERICALRAHLHEFGVHTPTGAAALVRQLPEILDQATSLSPRLLRFLRCLHDELRQLEQNVDDIETELARIAAENADIQRLCQVPGVGLITATALYASIGSIRTFRSGRHLASWLGITPRESSSGSRRRLGRISKQGDPYLRTLLIHGARSALLAAGRKAKATRPLSRMEAWALQQAAQKPHNKAAVALANKMARVLWALWYHQRDFNAPPSSQAQLAA